MLPFRPAVCQRAAWPGQILLYNGGETQGEKRGGGGGHGLRGGKGRGAEGGGREEAGGERANALLMGFIQAWKLQARPPHGRIGVNPLPPPSLSLHSASRPDCCRSSEVEHESASAAAYLQSVFLTHDASHANTQTTVL